MVFSLWLRGRLNRKSFHKGSTSYNYRDTSITAVAWQPLPETKRPQP